MLLASNSTGSGFNVKYGKAKGLTLIEVMIGMVVLMLILFPAMATVSQTTRIMDKARSVNLASSVGQSLMEQMRTQTFAGIAGKYCGVSAPVAGTHYAYTGANFATDIANEQFSSQNAKNFTVTGDFYCPATGQLEVTLTIAWKDLNGVPQSYKLFTIISEGGLSDNVNKGW